MNFKVKCIKSNPNVYEGITEGNIYEIVDGKFLDDNGMKRPVWKKVESFDEMLAIYDGRCGCDFELVDYVLSISDIKPCMLVELRKGTWCMIMETKSGLFLVDEFGNAEASISSCAYDNQLKATTNLSSKTEFDIMRVYDLTESLLEIFEFTTENRELLRERKEKTKMTLAEVEERLGMEIEII